MTTALNKWMDENVGERCPDYEPGCPVCDAWHLYDINAFEALSIEMKSTDDFMDEWNSIVPTQWDIDNGYAEGEQYELWNEANDLRIEQMVKSSTLYDKSDWRHPDNCGFDGPGGAN